MPGLELKRDPTNTRIWSHVRRAWIAATPEAIVRQSYLLTLVNDYGFALDQIAEDINAIPSDPLSPVADFVIWRTAEDRSDNAAPLIIVQCKSDIITVRVQDYPQGAAYARISKAPFLVTRNSREARYWKVTDNADHIGHADELADIPHRDSAHTHIQALLNSPRTFKEGDFATLLHNCHNIIRNREKKDPAAAFDEMAKVLFVKVYAEKMTAIRPRQPSVPWTESCTVLDRLFQETKEEYADDAIFHESERIDLKPSTLQEILKQLAKYNLADTRDDIKGVAFERFLGRTFRGEIGQFFTPRTIVEFMVHMVDPRENDIVCDPACGSGGFLIRVFEIVREKVLARVQQEYSSFRSDTMADATMSETKKAEILQRQFRAIEQLVDQRNEGSRLWTLANRCIYGMDANDRMARISKMNMIMHGDGHGGIHHHDGFLNVDGIFDGRFDVVLTNPPFGSIVEAADRVTDSDTAVSSDVERRNRAEYGELYSKARDRLKVAVGLPIASLFEVAKSDRAKTKTEILFIERCLNLLKPGGRLGIVLPEGIFNNPSLAYVREFVEERAFVRAVVSLPQETFLSTGASVKCSLLFLQKFTEGERQSFQAIKRKSMAEIKDKFEAEVQAGEQRAQSEIDGARAAGDQGEYARLRRELRRYLRETDARRHMEGMRLVRTRFDYPIFMFEAERVGITATGDEDQDDLVRNDRQGAGSGLSCLERYRKFLETGLRR